MLDVQKAMEDGAPLLHGEFPNNILKHTQIRQGDYEKAIREPGLIKVEGWYETPVVQHCHIENFICFAEKEGEKINVTSSTQIPHIVRRIVGQALGIDWGRVRVIKPYIGGGFGNKQDILYEPLCAWLSLQTGGHLVKLDVPREETFYWLTKVSVPTYGRRGIEWAKSGLRLMLAGRQDDKKVIGEILDQIRK